MDGPSALLLLPASMKANIMNIGIIRVVATLTVVASSGALLQASSASTLEAAVTRSVAIGSVGKWLHDTQGTTIGSVRRLTDGGRTAMIIVGSYFQPGSHEERVPARMLSMVDGKVTLQTGTMQALNSERKR